MITATFTPKSNKENIRYLGEIELKAGESRKDAGDRRELYDFYKRIQDDGEALFGREYVTRVYFIHNPRKGQIEKIGINLFKS